MRPLEEDSAEPNPIAHIRSFFNPGYILGQGASDHDFEFGEPAACVFDDERMFEMDIWA